MPADFDLYCARSPIAFEPGISVDLDGIDGFFDQYFEAAQIGETIRFAVLYGGPSNAPWSVAQLAAMPFITARVESCDSIAARVQVLSVQTLGEWSRSVQSDAADLRELEKTLAPVSTDALIAGAYRDGSSLWRSGKRYWRSLDEVSVVGAYRDGSDVRVVVLHTNAVPGFVVRVSAPFPG